MNSVKVSVIVPVYKVEKYIRQCAVSLFSQTLDDLEYIFVNDCTPDNSMKIIDEVLAEFPSRRHQVKIINHSQNKGATLSRKEGLAAARGEYVIYCDSDDWVERDMYESMYNEAKTHDVDIVICDYFEDYCGRNSIAHVQQLSTDKKEIFENINQGKLQAYLVDKMIKREFLLKLSINQSDTITLWDDMSIILPLLLSTDNIYKLNRPMYHYMMFNAGSITSNIDFEKKTRSMLLATECIRDFLIRNNLFERFELQYKCLMLKATSLLITKESCRNIKSWRRLNDITISEVLQSKIGNQMKVMSIMAILHLDSLINLLGATKRMLSSLARSHKSH